MKILWVKNGFLTDYLGASSTLLKKLAVDDQLSYRNIMRLKYRLSTLIVNFLMIIYSTRKLTEIINN